MALLLQQRLVIHVGKTFPRRPCPGSHKEDAVAFRMLQRRTEAGSPSGACSSAAYQTHRAATARARGATRMTDTNWGLTDTGLGDWWTRAGDRRRIPGTTPSEQELRAGPTSIFCQRRAPARERRSHPITTLPWPGGHPSTVGPISKACYRCRASGAPSKQRQYIRARSHD